MQNDSRRKNVIGNSANVLKYLLIKNDQVDQQIKTDKKTNKNDKKNNYINRHNIYSNYKNADD